MLCRMYGAAAASLLRRVTAGATTVARARASPCANSLSTFISCRPVHAAQRAGLTSSSAAAPVAPTLSFRSLAELHQHLGAHAFVSAAEIIALLADQRFVQPTAHTYHVAIRAALFGNGISQSQRLKDALKIVLHMRALRVPVLTHSHVEIVEAALCLDARSRVLELSQLAAMPAPSAEHIAIAVQLVDELVRLSHGLWGADAECDDDRLVHRLVSALASHAATLPSCMQVMQAVDAHRSSMPLTLLLAVWRKLATVRGSGEPSASLSSVTINSQAAPSTAAAEAAIPSAPISASATTSHHASTTFDLNGTRDAIWFGIRRLLTHADLSTALSAADFELAIECMCHAGDVDAAVHMLQLLLRNRHRPSPRVFLWLVDAMLHAIARSAATCVYANVCNRIADLDRLLRLIAVHRVEIAPPTVALIVRALLDSFYFSVRSGQDGTLPFETPASLQHQHASGGGTWWTDSNAVARSVAVLASRSPVNCEPVDSLPRSYLASMLADPARALGDRVRTSMLNTPELSVHQRTAERAAALRAQLETVLAGWLSFQSQRAATNAECGSVLPFSELTYLREGNVDELACVSVFALLLEHPVWSAMAALTQTGQERAEQRVLRLLATVPRVSFWQPIWSRMPLSFSLPVSLPSHTECAPLPLPIGILSAMSSALAAVVHVVNCSEPSAHQRTALQALKLRMGAASVSALGAGHMLSTEALCWINSLVTMCVAHADICSTQQLSEVARNALLPILAMTQTAEGSALRAVQLEPGAISPSNIAQLLDFCAVCSERGAESAVALVWPPIKKLLLQQSLSHASAKAKMASAPVATPAASMVAPSTRVTRAGSASGLRFRAGPLGTISSSLPICRSSLPSAPSPPLPLPSLSLSLSVPRPLCVSVRARAFLAPWCERDVQLSTSVASLIERAL